MLWDDEAFYVAAEMEEPDVWGTLTARDSVIFHDNDFEVFIDPDGDTHEYYELEVNALNTVWDLMLVRPYRDGGPPIDAWDIAGLRTAVNVRGRINSPGTPDEGWSVEIAMPWRVLREAAPGRKPPAPGQQWRVNFSRVEWPWQLTNGQYERKKDPATGRVVKEDNWVWSPQGLVDMHMPERWGFVQFSDRRADAGEDAFVENKNERVKWACGGCTTGSAGFVTPMPSMREPSASLARTPSVSTGWISGPSCMRQEACTRSPRRGSTARRSISARTAACE
jgi:hypothetical protein